MLATEDPLSYVFTYQNTYLRPIRRLTETDKVYRLFDELPPTLRSAFVRDLHETVQGFTDWLIYTAREAAHN